MVEKDLLTTKPELLKMIVCQLKSFGLSNPAKVLADSLKLDWKQLEPSDKLLELCDLADKYSSSNGHHHLRNQQNDDEDENGDDEIIHADSHEDDHDNDADILALLADDQGLDLDKRNRTSPDEDPNSSSPKSSKPTPEFNCWFVGQHRESCHVAAYSKDGRYAASGSNDTSIKIIDVSRIHASYLEKSEDKPVVRTLYDHIAPVTDVKFHPNGKMLASASEDCNIKLYDLTKVGVKRGFRTLYDAYPVRSIGFHPSGDFLISGTFDASVRIYDIHTMQCYQPNDESSSTATNIGNDLYKKSINMVEYSPDGSTFASCSEDGSIKIWDAIMGRCVKTFENAHQGKRVSSIKYSRNGKYILSVGADSTGRLWDIGSAKILVKFEGASQLNTRINMVFSKTEDYVIGADEFTNSLACWDARTGDLLKKFPAHPETIRFIASSPVVDGILTCADDSRVKYWNLTV